jgi:hypothetical protein
LRRILISTTLAASLGNLGPCVIEFDKFYQFASLLMEDVFVLTYRGYVTEDVVKSIGNTLRQQLLIKSCSRNQISSLFSVFV